MAAESTLRRRLKRRSERKKQPVPATSPMQNDLSQYTLYCSFCGKSQHEVSRLIAGPAVFICDECTELCDYIVLENRFPDRVLMKIHVPRRLGIDDFLLASVSEFMQERLGVSDFRFEGRSIGKNSDGNTEFAYFSFQKSLLAGEQRVGNDIDEIITPSRYIADLITEISVANVKYVSENEKARRLEAEIRELKDEYLGYLREKIVKPKENTEPLVVAFLDVQGFSKYPDKEKKALIGILRSTVSPLFEAKGARQINMWGDGIVGIFDDPTVAVESAIKFIRHLRVEGFEARIGMAWGPVRVSYNPAIDRLDIDSAVVDLAARIEPLAGAGEILLTTEFSALKVPEHLAKLVRVRLPLVKDLGIYKAGDIMELLKVVPNAN